MTSTQLPPLNLGGDGLRISLFGPESTGIAPSVEIGHPKPEDTIDVRHEPEELAEPKYVPPVSCPQNIPIHPIPSFQEAFAESLDEATNASPGDKPKLRKLDALQRREALMSQDRDDEPFDVKWRFRNGQEQHELVKLIAQISFGVYLLLNGMANSNIQVVNILQSHIDEVDEFLEVALEDLRQATDDLTGRIEHLKLPLANVQVFEQLLEDRNFRLEIIEGNQKIDHVISRTSAALKQWETDIEAGLNSTAAFTSWLNDEQNASWRTERPDVADIFDAMKGNTEGWLTAFDEMSDRAQEASNMIGRLSTIIGEMEKKAGEVSRRTWASIQPFTVPSLGSRGGSISNTLSMKSGISSRLSNRVPTHQPHSSVQSLGTSTGSTSTFDINPEEDFPLPGGLPLLPPSRSDFRLDADAKSGSQRSSRAPSSAVPSQSKHDSKLANDALRSPSSCEESLYVLQPHTYSPKPLETGPSPTPSSRVISTTVGPTPEQQPPSAPKNPLGVSGHGLHQRKASIRNRVAQKTVPPGAIHIPSRTFRDVPAQGPSSSSAIPRTTQYNPFDSAYGSDGESATLPASSDHSLSPPRRPAFTHSPRSDQQQYYRPVRASPHSPLQQRPHTAVGAHASSYGNLRHRPSALGGMSMLQNVTNAVHDDDDARPRTAKSRAGHDTLKKKKSAFGWFKKAFSLDEEEKAAFEARKAMQHNDRYYSSNSPKFLDGRRIR